MVFEQDAFRHHIWATQRVLDACEPLTAEQLAAPTVGTYGGILETLQHLVGSDAWYLYCISGHRIGTGRVNTRVMGIAELREVVEGCGSGWETVLDEPLDPDAEIVTDVSATVGIRLSQVVHHGTDHRSQVCTALTALGFEPPAIDLWDYGETVGRVREED